MKVLWKIDLQTLELFYKILEEVETKYKHKLNRQEKEIVFLELMKQKKIKPCGHTELNQNELVKEIVSKGQSILNIDKKGYTFIKKKKA